MALDEKLVTEALGKLKEVIVKIMEERVKFLDDSEFQKLFSDNAELVDKAQLTDKELDELIKILRKNNPAVDKDRFQEAMKELEGKHLDRLRELNKVTEEAITEQKKGEKDIKKLIGKAAQDAAGIVDQVVEEDMQTKEYDEQKKKRKILYYYVWWLLDSEEDYHALVSDPHDYPRDRGTLKVHYKELGNKNIDEALAGVKHSGKVAGEFLGALGLIGKNEYFENIVPRVNLKPGQLIALGAARAKRWDWRTREIRGLNNDKLGRADPERFIWKWNRFNPMDEGKGTIKGRVVFGGDFEAHKADIAYLMNPANDIGIADAKVWAESGDQNLVGNKKADEKGFFTLEGIPLNIAVTVKADAEGYTANSHKIPPAPIVLTPEKKVEDTTIVPLNPSAPPADPIFTINLHSHDAGHKRPLEPKFGNTEAFEVGNLQKDFRTFTVTKRPKRSKKVENAWYYFMASQMQSADIDNQDTDKILRNINVDGRITRRSKSKKQEFEFKFNELHKRVFDYNEETDSVGDETLEVEFHLEGVPKGKYRIWCLLLKSEAIDKANCWDYNYFEFFVGPVPMLPTEREKILRDIKNKTERFIIDNKIRQNQAQTLKWHKEKDVKGLEELATKIEELKKKNPQFFEDPEIKKIYERSMQTLTETIKAWKTGNIPENIEHESLKVLMEDIVWLEQTIEHFK